MSERAKFLRSQADSLASEADSLRAEAAALDKRALELDRLADEAEKDDRAVDEAWAEMRACRLDPRQQSLWGGRYA